MFRLVAHPENTYAPVGCCIYCNSAEGLSDEHVVIPFGLGGRWVLPKASCAKCAKQTGAFEGTCLRTMLGPLRMYVDLPTRRRKEHPRKLPLKVKLSPGDEWSFIDVDQAIYPFLVLFPLLSIPDELSGCATSGERGAAVRHLWVRAASFRDGIIPHLEALATELNVAAIEPTATVRAPEFFRMLAKIAHAFAVAEMGIVSFSPFLTSMICDGDVSNSVQSVGGLRSTEPATVAIHELSFSSHARCPDIVAVRIRLLAALETPTYYVAVGKGPRLKDLLGRPRAGTSQRSEHVNLSAFP